MQEEILGCRRENKIAGGGIRMQEGELGFGCRQKYYDAGGRIRMLEEILGCRRKK